MNSKSLTALLTASYRLLSRPFLCIALVLSSVAPVLAWDSVGHRLTAAVALEFLSEETRGELLAILREHPRYQEDFLDQLPGYIDDGDQAALAQWLLGQAAYWPDIARGLPDRDRNRFNRPTWHYTDGAWVRGAALTQGNLYIGIESFTDLRGDESALIDDESDAHNVVTAIDYNTQILTDPDSSPAARAVALCWVLHLMGDIHQPMHTGSLYSAATFVRGDLGGNRIPVRISDRELNLHAAWDGALREFGVAESLPEILAQVSGFTTPRIEGVASDWTAWMSESRQLLHSAVYSDTVIRAAADADARQLEDIEQAIQLTNEYSARMRQIARQRLGLAGLRLAIWFENELP